MDLLDEGATSHMHIPFTETITYSTFNAITCSNARHDALHTHLNTSLIDDLLYRFFTCQRPDSKTLLT